MKGQKTTFTFQLPAAAKKELREQAKAIGVTPGRLVRLSLRMFEAGFLPLPLAPIMQDIREAGAASLEADPGLAASVDALRAQGDDMALERLTAVAMIHSALRALQEGLIPVADARELATEMAQRLALEEPAVDTDALLAYFEQGLEARRRPALN